MERGLVGTALAGSGLDPAVVARWQHANGLESGLGDNSSRLVRTRGGSGIGTYPAFVDLDAERPDDFEQIAYWRPLAKMFTFSLLQTSVRTRRTRRHIHDHPSNFLIFVVQTIGTTTGKANGRTFSAQPGQLTIADSRFPYEVTTHGVAGVTGIWVPIELLDSHIAAGATVSPIPADTLLTRSCASLVLQLARDAAIGGMDVDIDTEMAVIDVVAAMLRQGDATDLSLDENPLYLRDAVLDVIDQHFHDPEFGTDSVAMHLHISKRHLYRRLEAFDLSLSEMIADRRLEWARKLLAQPGRVRIEDIARSAGFASPATLRNRFRAKYGMTPAEYHRSVTDNAKSLS